MKAMTTKNLPIRVECQIDFDGTITPNKWTVVGEDEAEYTYEISEVINRDKRRIAGKWTMEIRCFTSVNGTGRPIEIRYDYDSTQWRLFKI